MFRSRPKDAEQCSARWSWPRPAYSKRSNLREKSVGKCFHKVPKLKRFSNEAADLWIAVRKLEHLLTISASQNHSRIRSNPHGFSYNLGTRGSGDGHVQ